MIPSFNKCSQKLRRLKLLSYQSSSEPVQEIDCYLCRDVEMQSYTVDWYPTLDLPNRCIVAGDH